jgi:hypothetical protein
MLVFQPLSNMTTRVLYASKLRSVLTASCVERRSADKTANAIRLPLNTLLWPASGQSNWEGPRIKAARSPIPKMAVPQLVIDSIDVGKRC